MKVVWEINSSFKVIFAFILYEFFILILISISPLAYVYGKTKTALLTLSLKVLVYTILSLNNVGTCFDDSEAPI